MCRFLLVLFETARLSYSKMNRKIINDFPILFIGIQQERSRRLPRHLEWRAVRGRAKAFRDGPVRISTINLYRVAREHRLKILNLHLNYRNQVATVLQFYFYQEFIKVPDLPNSEFRNHVHSPSLCP